jgi:hypothetical protein
VARARQLGMLTYRGRDELDTRFGVLVPELDRPPVAAYLDHHGERFAARFPVRTFLLLSEAIDRSHFGTDRATLRAELARVTADVLVVGVPGDLVFPFPLQHELYRELQAVGATCSLWKLDSEYGHDAFLADQVRLAALLRDAHAFDEAAPRERFEGVGARPIREIRIGMVGCGTVGSGVLELLERQADAMAERYGVRFRVTRIAVRDLARPRTRRADGIARTATAIELVGDPEVDVIVEVAGGLAVEATVAAALAAGKPVVTANKALLARKLAELGVLAQRTGTPLLCEAAAAAALPIIRHLSHRADEIDSLMAIVNGTCNYIITRLEQDEWALDRAIVEAQRLGLAEAGQGPASHAVVAAKVAAGIRNVAPRTQSPRKGASRRRGGESRAAAVLWGCTLDGLSCLVSIFWVCADPIDTSDADRFAGSILSLAMKAKYSIRSSSTCGRLRIRRPVGCPRTST